MIAAILTLCGSMALTSCIKDERANSECDILGAWVEGDAYKQYFTDESQMRPTVLYGSNTVQFTVKTLSSLPAQIPVWFEVTPGATIEPASGTAHDFRRGPVTYTVTSEDGKWSRQYEVCFIGSQLPSFLFKFDHYETVTSITNSEYHSFYEVDDAGTRWDIWASGNMGASITMPAGSGPEKFPTSAMTDGASGTGVRLQTIYGGDLAKMFGKPIAAGSLYLGSFDLNQALLNSLMSTRFGQPIDKDPVKVTGKYKYKPGPEFRDKDYNVVPGRIDEGDIYAVFFKSRDKDGNDFVLTGDNVLTSEYIVKKARVASLPATDEWTPFEMSFNEAEVDYDLLANGGYKMTLVFSSSKEGALFEGAVGSELCVDEVEVTFKDIVTE